MDIKRYWEPVFEADHSKSLEEYVDEIDAAMQDSIKAHKVADVEVGSFLSSGVDSSYVAACFHGDKTFTVGFDYEKYNEIDYAKALSEKIKIDNYSKLISKKEYWDSIPTVQYHMDEPLADASAIALYFVTKTASEQVKTCMSGEGADELFGGYNIYREPHDLLPLTRLPRPIRKGLGAMAQKLPKMKGKNYLIRGSKDLQERFIGNAFMLNEAERERILKHPTGKYPHTALTKPFYDKAKDLDDVTKMQYIDIHFWLIGDILLKADKMSMANSLEVRVPFLDRVVFDVARKVPTEYKVNKENTKFAMRQAAHRYLPDMVAEKKKLGFPVPIMRELERICLLKCVDRMWMDHIDNMDQLRQGIALRGYGQKDPVVEYRIEGFDMFDQMVDSIRESSVKMLLTIEIRQAGAAPKREQVAKPTGEGFVPGNGAPGAKGAPHGQPVRVIKIGRNDPCPCGSGLKWKKCTCAKYHPEGTSTNEN